MNKLVKIYGSIVIGFTAIFLILFRTQFIASQHVLFYRGLWLLGITSIMSLGGIIWFCMKVSKKWAESMLAALVLAISLNLSMFVLFPVSIERSVSVFLLNALSQGKQELCGGLSKEDMQNQLINQYVIKNDGIGKRIEEQSGIAMIQQQSGCYQLTKRGDKFIFLSNIIKILYNIP